MLLVVSFILNGSFGKIRSSCHPPIMTTLQTAKKMRFFFLKIILSLFMTQVITKMCLWQIIRMLVNLISKNFNSFGIVFVQKTEMLFHRIRWFRDHYPMKISTRLFNCQYSCLFFKINNFNWRYCYLSPNFKMITLLFLLLCVFTTVWCNNMQMSDTTIKSL